MSSTFLSPIWIDSVGSTNSALLGLLERGEAVPSGYVLAAREQTAGRGRFDRKWISGRGRDLTFSFFLAPAGPPSRLPSLPMSAALAVADALANLGVDAWVKWPNDVITPRGKICGILSEQAVSRKGRDGGVVVGIGVNLNMTAEEAAIVVPPATSVWIETARRLDPEGLLSLVLRQLERRMADWMNGGFAAIRDEWTRCAAWVGKRVLVMDGDRRMEGILDGFGEDGELTVRDGNGTVHSIWTGDLRRAAKVF